MTARALENQLKWPLFEADARAVRVIEPQSLPLV